MQLSTPAFLFSGLLSLCLFISGFLLLLPPSFCPSLYILISLSSASSSSSSVLCLWFYHILGVVPFLLWFFVLLPLVLEVGCWRLWRRWSMLVLVSALSSAGLSLRLLCSWFLYSITSSSEMKGQRRWWGWGCLFSWDGRPRLVWWWFWSQAKEEKKSHGGLALAVFGDWGKKRSQEAGGGGSGS